MEVIDAEASTLSEKWSLVYRLLAEIIMEEAFNKMNATQFKKLKGSKK